MAELSHGDIQHLARLARLELTASEMDRYAAQLTNVVAYVDQLSTVDTSAVTVHTGVTGLLNVARDDVPGAAPFDLEKALAALPRRDGHFIEVRAVLGGEAEVS